MSRIVLILIVMCSFVLGLEYSQEDRERMIKMETKMEEGFKSIENRFEQIDNRFEQIQNQINNTNQIMLGLMGGIFAMIGFMWWDRRTVISQAKEEIRVEIKENLASKADQSKLEKVFEILAELAQKDKNIRDVMEKHHLKLI